MRKETPLISVENVSLSYDGGKYGFFGCGLSAPARFTV